MSQIELLVVFLIAYVAASFLVLAALEDSDA